MDFPACHFFAIQPSYCLIKWTRVPTRSYVYRRCLRTPLSSQFPPSPAIRPAVTYLPKNIAHSIAEKKFGKKFFPIFVPRIIWITRVCVRRLASSDSPIHLVASRAPSSLFSYKIIFSSFFSLDVRNARFERGFTKIIESMMYVPTQISLHFS